MWISIRETVVEERSFTVDSSKQCPSGNATLQLIRRDARAAFFLFPKKVTQLICEDTGKKIKSSQWSDEIKATALEMKNNLKVPMWGYWSFGIIAAIVFIGVPLGFIMEMKSAGADYISQTTEQKTIRLKALGKGDYVKTSAKLYRISTADDNSITLVPSTKPGNNALGFDIKNPSEANFTGIPVTVPKSEFHKSQLSPSEVIYNILDL